MSGPSLWKPAGLVVTASTSLQLGLAVAATMFAAAGPVSAVWVRSVVGATLLCLWIRPDVRAIPRAQRGPIVMYGLTLASMTLCAYVAIANAPLGIVSAIVMLGPLAIAASGHRTPLDLAMVAAAALGALLIVLSRGIEGSVSALGLLFAFLAAASFAAYIVVGKRVNAQGRGLSGLAVALVIAAIVQTPFGLLLARPGLLDVQVLLTLAAAGVLATLVPFTLEAVALRTLPMATFGLLLAFEPAVAALIGMLILGDSLTGPQWLGIVLIVVAAAGSLGPRDWMRRMNRDDAELMRDERVAALAKVPLLDGLSAGELATLARLVRERDVTDGEVLTREGDPGEDFFIIRTGSVDVVAAGGHVRSLGSGEVLGEIALLFGGTRTATVTAAEPTSLFVIDKGDFLKLLADHADIEDRILATVSERMRYR